MFRNIQSLLKEMADPRHQCKVAVYTSPTFSVEKISGGAGWAESSKNHRGWGECLDT